MRKLLRMLPVILLVGIGLMMMNHSDPARGETATTEPTSRPATTQPTFDLRGRVTIEAGWTLQPPDLTRVVVYLASNPGIDSLVLPSGHATVAQRHKAFVPNFVVIQKGTTVEFPNFDNFEHNVFSLSKAAPAFDLDRYPRGKSKSRVFEKVGIVQVFCNIHPKMRAIVVVTPNGFFARPDATGVFVIRNVPAGAYQVVAWQERCSDQTVSATIDSSGHEDELSIQLHANRHSIVSSEAPPESGGYGVQRGLGVKREHLNVPVVSDVHDSPDPEPKD